MDKGNGRVYLTRDQIQQAPDLVTEDVEVPEWGGWVKVRTLSGRERDQFESSLVEIRGSNRRMNLGNLRARLVSLSVVDGDGKRLFTVEDVKWLGEKSASALERVFDVSRRLSALTEEDVNELVQVLGEEESVSSGSA